MTNTPPPEVRAEARSIYETMVARQNSRDDLKKLQRAWGKCGPEAREHFTDLIRLQTGRPVVMDILWSDATELFTKHHYHLELSAVARPLVDWWIAQPGNVVAKTVYPTPTKPGSKAKALPSELITWLADEMTAIIGGRRLGLRTAKTLLEHLSR